VIAHPARLSRNQAHSSIKQRIVMFQLTIKQPGSTYDYSSCFTSIAAANQRADAIRGTFPRGVKLLIEVVELCDTCAGRGYVADRVKRRNLTEPCKKCNKTGVVRIVQQFEGD
jgi:hypothetical protein